MTRANVPAVNLQRVRGRSLGGGDREVLSGEDVRVEQTGADERGAG